MWDMVDKLQVYHSLCDVSVAEGLEKAIIPKCVSSSDKLLEMAERQSVDTEDETCGGDSGALVALYVDLFRKLSSSLPADSLVAHHSSRLVNCQSRLATSVKEALALEAMEEYKTSDPPSPMAILTALKPLTPTQSSTKFRASVVEMVKFVVGARLVFADVVTVQSVAPMLSALTEFSPPEDKGQAKTILAQLTAV